MLICVGSFYSLCLGLADGLKYGTDDGDTETSFA